MKSKIIYTLLLLVFVSCSTVIPQCNKNTGSKSADSLLTDLQNTYGLCLEIIDPSGTSWSADLVHFEKLEKQDHKEMEKYCQLFRSEFFKYPKEFIAFTKLQRIILVKDLYNQGVPVAAMPDYYKENLYIDIYVGNYDPLYQRHVIHHEFYHMIEEQFNGNPYYVDPEWNKFNDPAFKYGTGGINNRTEEMRPITHPLPGFISLYSATGLEEDKAEIFAALMTSEEREMIMPWTKDDLILKNKIEYLISFLKNYGIDLNKIE
jgi:hypothetical protein